MCRLAALDNSGANVARGLPVIDEHDARGGRIDPPELLLQGDAYISTEMALAISTPVGPPPTSTKVSRFLCRAGSSSASANSNARRILLRSATASAGT